MANESTTARIDTLRGIPLFASLPDRALERLIECANEVDVPAGQVLVESHMEGSGLFVIEEGECIVEAPKRKATLGPGEFFGELALLTPEAHRTARVRASTPCRVLAISRHDFRDLLESEPKLGLAMLEALAERLVKATS
jgi:CRP-like cAMP-binding protein